MKQRKKRNVIAKDLRSPNYRQRKEKPAKGKGSFDRNVEKAKKYLELTFDVFLEATKRARDNLIKREMDDES